MKQIEELRHLVALFDDPDEVVCSCVDRRIAEMGSEVIPLLEKIRHNEPDAAVKRLISDRILRYNAEFRTADLRRYALHEATQPTTLYEGCFLATSLLNPQITRDRFEEAFYQCACEFQAEASDNRTALEEIGVFNHLFYHRLRFTVTDQNLTTEKNAMLYETLKSRRGNPFAIATVYMMLAEETGLPLLPLCFPGGFVPAYVEDGKELFYINLLQNGEVFPQTRLKDYLIGQGIPFDHNRFLLRRQTVMLNIYLESLIYLYDRLGETASLERIAKALEALGDERFLISEDKQEED
ncbi:MAG: hypothetical protein J5495_00185 [Bacteroidales bacterium]|nr:hypothetical protein [Bacteroidales bacterium]